MQKKERWIIVGRKPRQKNVSKNLSQKGKVQWYMPVIPGILEVEIVGQWSKANPREKHGNKI
jgi:hypothetical protein